MLRPSEFPEMLNYKGDDLIVTDGTTLLGADDKAGIAEIISAVAYLQQHPEIEHGKVRIAFNPDEEMHPGYAKHKMVNSIRMANQFILMLPRWETPEHTEGYEGFYHLVHIEGGVEQTTLTYIIRDHDRDRFERRKKELEHLVRKTNNEFPGCCSIEIKDQYYNMREKIEPVMYVVEIAEKAMTLAGVTPKV